MITISLNPLYVACPKHSAGDCLLSGLRFVNAYGELGLSSHSPLSYFEKKFTFICFGYYFEITH